MLRNANSESEILLGNTQLIGIFFLLAVLLGVAFTAGFMLGHGSFGKKMRTPSADGSPVRDGSQIPAQGRQSWSRSTPGIRPESKVAPEPRREPTSAPGDSVSDR